MLRIACIVCESSGAWARALRRRLDDSLHRVCETRSLDGLETAWSEHPLSFVVVAAELAAPEELLARLCAWNARRPHGRMAVAGVSDASTWNDPLAQALLAEWGVDASSRSPLECESLAGLIRRHAAISPEHASHDERPPTFRQTIWARLPWGAVTKSRSSSPQGKH